MTRSNDTDASKKPLKLSRPKLELKKTVDGGQVRQSFPHGRTKTVAVEVKRKRTYARGNGDRVTEVTTEPDSCTRRRSSACSCAGRGPAAATGRSSPHRERARGAPEGAGQAKRDDEVRRQVEMEVARQRARKKHVWRQKKRHDPSPSWSKRNPLRPPWRKRQSRSKPSPRRRRPSARPRPSRIA